MSFEKNLMKAMANRNMDTPPTKEESYNLLLECMIREYNLEGVDIDKEFDLVAKKESRLSRRQRDAIQQIYTLKKIQSDVLKQVEEEAAKKASTEDNIEIGEVIENAEVSYNVGDDLPEDVIDAEIVEDEKLPPPPAEIKID